MAILFSGQRRFGTSSTNPLNNQAQATVRYLYRFEPSGTPATANKAFLVSRDSYAGFYHQVQGAGTAANTVRVKFAWVNAANVTASILVDIPVGVTQEIFTTYDGAAGEQWLFRNGVAARIGSLTGNTYTSSKVLLIGGWDSATILGAIHTIDGLAIWHGYAGSNADAIALRDGTATPQDLGTGATLRCRWSLAGTTGATVNLGDPGLAELNGQPAYNFTAALGGGTAVYSDALTWAPSADVWRAYGATSGRSIGFRLRTVGTGSVAIPTTVYQVPQVRLNGGSWQSLGQPWVTGIHDSVLFGMPAGVTIQPGDAVEIQAPTGWLDTTSGLARVFSGQVPSNLGRSCFGSDAARKTLRPGFNSAGEGTGYEYVGVTTKNYLYRAERFLGETAADATGKITAMSGTQGQAGIVRMNPANGLDATQLPGPVGLFAVQWDDLDPANPTSFWLGSSDNGPSATTTYTPRPEYDNPGSGGIGKVKVYEIQRKPGSTTVATSIYLWVSQAQKTPKFANLTIHGPGDFTPGTPTVLDRRDPWAPSDLWLAKVGYGAGHMRWMDNLTEYGGTSRACEPEHVRLLTDFAWSWNRYKTSTTIRYTQARPWVLATTPWIYSPIVGDPYDVVLAADATSGATVLTITPDSAAPVFYGQRLIADSEVMRVLSVSGSSVTVVRACEGTTAAAHAAGTIQAGYRFAAPSDWKKLTLGNNGHVWEYVTQDPHGLQTGTTVKWSGTGWPTYSFTDATTEVPTSFGGMAWVTGPNTFAIAKSYSNAAPVTLSTTYTLDPANQFSTIQIPGGPTVPYGFAAIATGRVKGCDLHLNIPHGASHDLVLQIFREVRDNFPAGRNVWVEWSNEPWNSSFGQSQVMAALSRTLYPGETDYAHGCQQLARDAAIARAVFDEGGRGRSGEIKTVVNCLCVVRGQAAPILAYCRAQGIGIDAIAIAPYIDPPNDLATAVAMDRGDSEQCLDIYNHWLMTSTSGSRDYRGHLAAFQADIDAHNAITGGDTWLIGYEGGLQVPIPEAISGPGTIAVTNGSGAVTGSGTSFTQHFQAGGRIRIGSATYYTILSIADDTHLTLTTNYTGTTTGAASYALGVRAWVEKARDMAYSPNFYPVQQDEFLLGQEGGFKRWAKFAFFYDYFKDSLNQYNLWGYYHYAQQAAGRGDGSDGKPDNRLCLAVQGLPNSKAGTTNQDLNCCSVRGQAHLDWNRDAVRQAGRKTISRRRAR